MSILKSLKTTLILGLVLCYGLSLLAQETRTVLTPENANEARLNGLQPPEQVMDAIGIRPGMTVAEIGAGRGRYVVQIAARVGEGGKVYAEDIDGGSLRHLEQRCSRWGLSHVKTILGEVNDPKLPQGELDVIFIISSYHHFDDPVALLSNARSALKPDGILAIGEWLPRNGGGSEYSTPKKMGEQMREAGYSLLRIETFLQKNNMNLYIFRLDN